MTASERARARLERAWIARFAVRARVLAANRHAVRSRPREAARFLMRSRELSNFTYELENMDELIACAERALEPEPGAVAAAVAELEDDAELRAALAETLRANPKRDDEPRYGYRYLYYAIARVRRPRAVVEVGTHDGLGAAVILRALERNRADGHPGKLVTLDTSADSGWLIPGFLRGSVERSFGDAGETLPRALDEHGCDFLIDDIGFGFPDKPAMFEAALGRARDELVIASEFPARTHADPPTALERLARGAGGRYAEFVERPREHFWPGHTQGLALFGARSGSG